jgi:5'-deoxynucleotidase YfbR-like HD superfamily hydrolase
MLSKDINDPESYMEHLYAVGCNAMMIHEQLKHEK